MIVILVITYDKIHLNIPIISSTNCTMYMICHAHTLILKILKYQIRYILFSYTPLFICNNSPFRN